MNWRLPDPPAGWPKHVSLPLFADQAEDTLDAFHWSTHLIQPLLLVRCGECGSFVMEVDLPVVHDPDDPEGFHRVCPHGPLVRGTIRTASIRLELSKGTVGLFRRMCECWPEKCTNLEHQSTGSPPKKHQRVPLDDEWLALLDRVPDQRLPAWCDRHGRLEVDVRELRRRAAVVIAEQRLVDKTMTTIPEQSTRTR